MQFAGTHLGSTTFGYSTQAIGSCPQGTGPGMPTSVTNALNQTALSSYFNSGKLACTQDANGKVTQYGYDALGRIMQVGYPDSGSTSASYSSSPPLSTTVTRLQNASSNIVRQTVLDGFGCTTQQILFAPEGQLCTEMFYDAFGNVSAINNPRGAVLGQLLPARL
jgi:YD repeat-containing protein